VAAFVSRANQIFMSRTTPRGDVKLRSVDNPLVARSGPVRRRQAGVLLVGATEPEILPWLRAARHIARAAPDVKAALAALEEEPADLIIVDRDRRGLDAPAVCRALRKDPRVGDAWLLAITVQ